MDPELQKIWSSFGLSPQAFPLLYALGPSPLRNAAGAPSGAAGSESVLTRELSNFPHMLIGIRLRNVYAFAIDGQDPDSSIAQYRALHEWTDDEQTVSVELAQQNPLSSSTLQSLVQGQGGYHWHPWPVPFPMAGGNNITVRIRRVTGYPLLAGAEVLPEVYGTLVTAVLRADYGTVPPRRRE